MAVFAAPFDWNQYQTQDAMPMADASRAFDPSQQIANTGISGGMDPASGVQTTTTPTTGGPVTIEQFNQAWMQSPYPGTVDGLKQFYAAHPEYAAAGITLGGSKGDKVYGPGGTYWGDYVQSAGMGGGVGKLTGSGPSAGGGITNGSTLGSLGYDFGASMKPFTGTFSAPTAEEALNSPGLQFALSEANRMGQNSAAARGTLLNGRFQQALAASNIGNALQGYGDLFNRNLTTFNTNRDIFYQNQDRPFNKSLSLAELGKPT